MTLTLRERTDRSQSGFGADLVEALTAGPRRYCDSRTCGNRIHVAAYRARRAATR